MDAGKLFGMFIEQRADPRERLALPLRMLDGSEAVTRDVSASGLFFEMAGEHHVGGLVDFEMQVAELHIRFRAIGRIVRVEHRAGITGVAVKLLAPRLESLD